MRRADNRLPIYILAALVGLAILWRIINPPAPASPGPNGSFPSWKSSLALGELQAQAVNPSGTSWAGVWNANEGDESRSAVRLIDFEKPEARTYDLENGLRGVSLGWADDNSLRVLAGRSDETAADRVIYVSAKTARESRTVDLGEPLRRILAWPAGSAVFVAEADSETPTLAIYSQSGKKVSADVKPSLPKGAEIAGDAVLSTERNSFVYTVRDKSEESGRAYYLADGRTGATRRIFGLADLPGKVERISVAGGKMLVICSERSRVRPAMYDTAGGKLTRSVPLETRTTFGPDAEKPLLFVTYDGGYRYDPGSGNTARLFDLSKVDAGEGSWREYIQGGRLYPIGDGYVSVTAAGKVVDIRKLRGNGTLERNLLPRY